MSDKARWLSVEAGILKKMQFRASIWDPFFEYHGEPKNMTMKLTPLKSTVTLILALGLLPDVLAQGANPPRQDQTIAQAVAATDTFSTLLAALDAADLVDVFTGEGPFTVFAPTNAAFAKLPKGTVESLLKPESKDQLTAILTYHVVSGEVGARQATQVRSASTLNGQRLDINFENGQLTVDESKIIQADLFLQNGVVHVIDQVLLPRSNNIVETAGEAGVFNTLLQAATEAGLADALSATDNITVFAPTDEAFAALPAGTIESLLKPENRGTLVEILSYHVIPERVYSDELFTQSDLDTLASIFLPVEMANGRLQVANGSVVTADIEASNGVIHIVDSVLLPSKSSSKRQASASVIEMAIEKGVPLFNMGQHGACADMYELAAFAVLNMDSANVPMEVRQRLRQGLQAARQMHNSGQRAWEMRYALDDALAMLN